LVAFFQAGLPTDKEKVLFLQLINKVKIQN